MKYKRNFVVCGVVCLVGAIVALAGDVMIGLSASLPVHTAKEAVMARVRDDQDPASKGYEVNHRPFGSMAIVEFRVSNGKQNTIRVDLKRPIFTRNWKVHGYRD